MASSSSHAQNEEKFDIIAIAERFLSVLSKFWILVLILALVFSGSTYLKERRSFRPRYQCSAIFAVVSSEDRDPFSGAYYIDSVTAKHVATTFPYLLETDFMRDLIAGQLESGVINGSIRASAIENTNMVEISVTSSDPQDAYDVLQAVLAAYPRAAVYMVDCPTLVIREEPVVPTMPINRFSPSGAVRRGALKGLVLGLGIVALLTALTRTVTSAEDLHKLVNLPILASFPLIRSKKRRKKASSESFITAADSPSLAEALRGLRTKVRKQLEQREGKVVLLTSTIPGEGKTTASVNLAMSLASEGYRVILLDADLRKQSVVRLFQGDQNSPGLMELLKNPNQSLDKCIKTVPNTNLRFISGTSTQKRHYSIDGKALARILDRLCAGFDYVIVDTPPCSVVSDTTLLCHYADAVVYVVRMDFANRFRILDGVTMIHQNDAPLIGCVVNGVPERRSHYGYGYGYGYGKKYGFDKAGFADDSQEASAE